MKRFLLTIFLVTFFANIQPLSASFSANAGVVKWGVKKIVVGAIKIVFSNVKESAVEHAKLKLLDYLKKNPQHIEYAKSVILQQMSQHPQFASRGQSLLRTIADHRRKSKF